MVIKIDQVACIGCGMCERICPLDIFRMGGDGRMTAPFIADCVTCLQCTTVCPTDAIVYTPAKPQKYNMNTEMASLKKLCGWADHPMAAETRMPPWMKAKAAGEAGGWAGKKSPAQKAWPGEDA